MSTDRLSPQSAGERILAFCLERPVVVVLLVTLLVFWGLLASPFRGDLAGLPRDPVSVDAIPDIGENQQIVFTSWPGRSPQDVEDQISYPLTSVLLSLPGVRTVRSFSMMGFSSVYVIFEDDVEFYWSRARILERLSSLPANSLPPDVSPTLGPDATALGQVFWYTLEGRDANGDPTGGWDLHELRSIQDYQVKYALLAAEGVSEVASVGGFVQEYQVDVDPDALLAYGVTLEQVATAVRASNLDVGARTLELNRVEYVVRGVGLIGSVEDLERSVVTERDHAPILVRDVATVAMGPALRRGALDKGGVEAVGGVVVVRYGENPLEAIEAVKAQIARISPGLPRKTLADGTETQVTIVPFYDRTQLIEETIDTLGTALRDEILITVLVTLVMVMHLRSAGLIAGLLPLAVLLSFVAMKLLRVEANVVALSGIAIAIGTMVDMAIVVTENVLRRVQDRGGDETVRESVFRATSEVSGAILTAVATTVISFLPVFAMTGAEGKLFTPLAYTKTFALIASLLLALLVIPVVAAGLLSLRAPERLRSRLPSSRSKRLGRLGILLAILVATAILTGTWRPLGPERSWFANLVIVVLLVGGWLAFLALYRRVYPSVLRWCLAHRRRFLALPITAVILGAAIWLGLEDVAERLPTAVRTWKPVSALVHAFPGLGREFMPPLDEGSFLFMPTTMPHASIGEAAEVVSLQDLAIQSIPEVRDAVGKIGRAESPLDPAPISMIETIINYHAEYLEGERGERIKFRFDATEDDFFRRPSGEPVLAPDGEPYVVAGTFLRDDEGRLIPDSRGRPFRLWRPALDPDRNEGRDAWPGIQDPDDIWDRIVDVSSIPGTTGAPRLQPIAARIVMLQSGMRAPLGIKVLGPDLETIEKFGLDLEREMKTVPGVRPETVIADRIVGKPYLEIAIDRDAAARFGLTVARIQNVIEVALGGRAVTRTVEGRERYSVLVRYARERRDGLESLERILVDDGRGTQIPLGQVATVEYTRGPQVIKSEDSFLVGYVIFDRDPAISEVDIVERADAFLRDRIASGDLTVPPGASYRFAGTYENQVRAQQRLAVILPVALALIFLLLYLQFHSVPTTAFVFSGVAVAWSGGFLMLWLYQQPWFLDFDLLGRSVRDLLQIGPVNLSVAVWVGFLALFGIATDDGVIMATYLRQRFRERVPGTVREVREATLEAAERRIRPCLMTTATTILALLPILTSTGRGSDIMIPMAIPSFGGVVFVLLTTLMVPVLYASWQESRLRRGEPNADPEVAP